MSERSELISKLIENKETRGAYIRAKLNVNIPSQIRALRQKREMTQGTLADEADMKQSRISAMERPGETKFNLETLIRLAAVLRVGLSVKFVSFSEMVKWSNEYSQDNFDVVKIENDPAFVAPEVLARETTMPKRTRDYDSWRLEKLADPEIAAGYLNDAKQDSPEMFLKALLNVTQSRQVAIIAKKAGVQRESIYRAFSEEGNPTLGTLDSVLNALGLRIEIVPKGEKFVKRRASAPMHKRLATPKTQRKSRLA